MYQTPQTVLSVRYVSVNESGNAVEGVNSVVPKEFLNSTIGAAFQAIGIPKGQIDFDVVGNILKPFLGDIDVALDIGDIRKFWKLPEDSGAFWEALKAKLDGVGVPSKVNRGFAQFHVLAPLTDQSGKQRNAVELDGTEKPNPGFVQIDFFLGSREWMRGIMSGAPKESKYKAVLRNLLLRSIVKFLPAKPNTRYSIDFRNGIQLVEFEILPPSGRRKTDKENVLSKKVAINSPDALAKLLFNKQWSEVSSFETMFSALNSSDFKFSSQLTLILTAFKNIISEEGISMPVELQENKLGLVAEGGLGGHLMHLYDNPDLTFEDLISIFQQAKEGTLEKVTEKLDGQNIFFSFDVPTNTARFARNKSDLSKGGMVKSDIDAKWTGKETVKQAFGQAYDMLQIALTSLNQATQVELFGNSTDIWYSAEILAAVNPNVINYDRNVIVPHEFGAIRLVKQGGEVSSDEEFDATGGFQKLKAKLNQLQASIAEYGWEIAEPILLKLNSVDEAPSELAIQKLQQEVSSLGLNPQSTIADYLTKKMVIYAGSKGVPESIAILIAQRMLDNPNKPARITDITKKIDPKLVPSVVEVDKQKDKLWKLFVRPVELIISDFAIGLLSGVQSAVAKNANKATLEINTKLKTAVDALKANPANLEFLNSQLEKLGSAQGTSIEGIVFRFKGNSYKFTGAFAPINQILGAVMYGRAGIVLQEGFSFEKQPKKQTVAIYPGAFKPYHAGHDTVVRMAAEAADVVYLLVSNKDRKRPGEFPVIGSAMLEVWNKYIIPTLPSNVIVKFADNPLVASYQTLEELNTQPVRVYMIASEEDLATRFKPASFEKTAPVLYQANAISVASTPRIGGTSGTKLREALTNSDLISFTAGLPESIRKNGKEIFDTLINAAKPYLTKTKDAPMKMKVSELKSLVQEAVKNALNECNQANEEHELQEMIDSMVAEAFGAKGDSNGAHVGGTFGDGGGRARPTQRSYRR